MEEYFYEEIPDELTGGFIKRVLSMSEENNEVTVKMFNEKLPLMQQFASEYLGIYVPDPNEEIKE